MLVLLTSQTFWRPWVVVEIVKAHQSNTQFVPLLLDFQDDERAFKFPSEADYKAIESGDRYDAQAWELFGDSGFSAVDIVAAFKALLSVIAKRCVFCDMLLVVMLSLIVMACC